jgi:SAM-dependent methyltransferase
MTLGSLKSTLTRLRRSFRAAPEPRPAAAEAKPAKAAKGSKPAKATLPAKASRAKPQAKKEVPPAKRAARQRKAAHAEEKKARRAAAVAEKAQRREAAAEVPEPLDLPLVDANVPCCVCGARESEAFFTTAYKTNKGAVPFHMRRCGGCGLLFNSPRLPDDRISDYYDGSYYVFKRSDAEYFQKSAQIYRRTLQCLETPEGRRDIAEIGSGKGYFLALLKDMGWAVQGIELAQDAADYAEREIGVPTFAGPLEAYLEANPGRSFPVIACIDVIEHVPDPAAFAAALARATVPGSLLVIDTPNARAQLIEEQGSDWRGFNPYHIFVFDADNMGRLLEAHGFLVLQAFTYNNGGEAEAPATPKGERDAAQQAAAARAHAVGLCRTQPSYFETDDARTKLAAERRGENLVVIAVRQGAES